jgi:hypothetical protein
MSLVDVDSLIAEYRNLKAKTERLGREYDEATRHSDEVGEVYLASKQELDNLQMSVMEAFVTRLDEEETIQ